MGRRAKTRMDEVVRNFMDAYRDSRSRDPVVITDQIDVRSWVLTSFQPVNPEHRILIKINPVQCLSIDIDVDRNIDI